MPTSAPMPLLGPWGMPRATARSARLSAAALTFTSTSLGLGFGCGISRSTSPFSLATPAFITSAPESLILLDRYVRRLGDVGPFAGLAREERREVLRRADAWRRPELGQEFHDVGRLQRLVDYAVELIDDGRRRAGGRRDAGQQGRHEAGHAGFRHGRNIRCFRAARRAGHTQCPQLTVT